MPIERRADETREEFVSRCVSKEMDGGMPQDQALAVCLTYADEYFASATSSVSDATWSTAAPISVSLGKRKKVLFEEDFDADKVKELKDMGFKVYIRSKRKIKKRDHKVWNKLKTAGLTEDNLVFGEIENLDKKYNFELLMTGKDPILERLKLSGQDHKPKRILHSEPVYSLEDAEMKMKAALEKIDLKFVSIVTKYKYEEIPGIPAAESGSRDFCRTMLDKGDRYYTLDEIRNLPNGHLKEMFAKYNLQPDVFLYRGGFYRLPGTLNTTPWCRHQWSLKIFME